MYKNFRVGGGIVLGLSALVLGLVGCSTTILRDGDNNINFCIDTTVLDTKKQSGDFNLGSNSYFFLGNQNRYATGFIFELDDIIIFDGSVDSSFKPDDYVSTSIFTQLLVIDSSGQVWGYSYDGSSSGGGGVWYGSTFSYIVIYI